MAAHPFIRILLFILLTCVGLIADGYGQTSNLPVEQWKAELYRKEDPRMEGVGLVVKQILALDSAYRCEAVRQLESAGPEKNIRFQIKLRLLDYWINVWFPDCANFRTIETRLKEAIRMAYETEDAYLIALINQELSDYYNRIGQYGLDNGGLGLVEVLWDGSVFVQNCVAGWISLDSISFRAD